LTIIERVRLVLSRRCGEGPNPGRSLSAVDRDCSDGDSEPIAEREQPPCELSNLAVGTQDRKIGGHVLDFRRGHGTTKSSPVSVAQVPGNDNVDRLSDCCRRIVAEQLSSAVTPGGDDARGVDHNHGVRFHLVIKSKCAAKRQRSQQSSPGQREDRRSCPAWGSATEASRPNGVNGQPWRSAFS